jgi:hypothetical protein
LTVWSPERTRTDFEEVAWNFQPNHPGTHTGTQTRTHARTLTRNHIGTSGGTASEPPEPGHSNLQKHPEPSRNQHRNPHWSFIIPIDAKICMMHPMPHQSDRSFAKLARAFPEPSTGTLYQNVAGTFLPRNFPTTFHRNLPPEPSTTEPPEPATNPPLEPSETGPAWNLHQELHRTLSGLRLTLLGNYTNNTARHRVLPGTFKWHLNMILQHAQKPAQGQCFEFWDFPDNEPQTP